MNVVQKGFLIAAVACFVVDLITGAPENSRIRSAGLALFAAAFLF